MWNCEGDDVVVTADREVVVLDAMAANGWCPDPDVPLPVQATSEATKTAASGHARNRRITANAISLRALGLVERHGARKSSARAARVLVKVEERP